MITRGGVVTGEDMVTSGNTTEESRIKRVADKA
jgi:hypothetical protein